MFAIIIVWNSAVDADRPQIIQIARGGRESFTNSGRWDLSTRDLYESSNYYSYDHLDFQSRDQNVSSNRVSGDLFVVHSVPFLKLFSFHLCSCEDKVNRPLERNLLRPLKESYFHKFRVVNI